MRCADSLVETGEQTTVAQRVAHRVGRQVLHGLVRPLRDRVFLPFLLLHVVLATVFFQFQLTLPVDMAAHDVSATGYGFLMALNGGLLFTPPLFAMRPGVHCGWLGSTWTLPIGNGLSS